jgi:cytochrome P450
VSGGHDTVVAPAAPPRTATGRLVEDVVLGARIGAMRAGGYVLALRGDRVARLLHRPWRLDPYPVYAELRAAQRAGGAVRSRTGLTAVATHASVEAVLRDRRLGVRLSDGRSRLGEGDGPSLMEPVDLSLLTIDPPDHTRLRRLAQPAFAPRRLAHYREVAEQVTGELLDAALDRGGPFDLVAELASPLPIKVISALLDVPDVDSARFARWGLALGSSLDGVRSPSHVRELTRATDDLRALFGQLLEQRRAHPGEDVISTLAGAVDGGTATPDEVLALAQLLLVAGFETTTNLIGNAVQAMHRTPGQWAALAADPSLAATAVEETLRYDPPVQLTARFAHEDVEIGDLRLRRDSGVLVLMASANRDPEVHPDPDRFDLHREQAAPHLAFSGGAHYCLGAPLARLEGEVALRLLAERAPRLRPAGDPVPRVATVLRGPLHLPVTA